MEKKIYGNLCTPISKVYCWSLLDFRGLFCDASDSFTSFLHLQRKKNKETWLIFAVALKKSSWETTAFKRTHYLASKPSHAYRSYSSPR